MLAGDQGRGIGRTSVRSEQGIHSMPRVFGSSAASLAHSSAFSFPSTPLWAEHHLISMLMPGFARLSAAMW